MAWSVRTQVVHVQPYVHLTQMRSAVLRCRHLLQKDTEMVTLGQAENNQMQKYLARVLLGFIVYNTVFI